MIRITKRLYINILTIIMFIICAFTHSLDILAITYLVMLLHELSHAAAAMCIGLRVSHISLHPFGVNLKLKNKIVCSFSDDVILYASGPLCNAALALFALFMYRLCPNYNLKFFYISNMMLFIMNMLPCAPLDGGLLLKRILRRRMGEAGAANIMRVISVFTALAVTALGVYVIYMNGRNFSALLFAALIIGNIFTQKEKYSTDFVRGLIFPEGKKSDSVHHIIAKEDIPLRETAKKIIPYKHNVLYITDKSGKISEIITDKQISDRLLNY